MTRSSVVPEWSSPAEGVALTATRGASADERVARVEHIVLRHLDAIWRTARELGVSTRDLDDVVQEVLIVCVRRLSDIEPERERAFLLATTSRVVANWRRSQRRRPAEPVEAVDEIAAQSLDTRSKPSNPAEMLEHKRELELVQAALEEMNEQQRVAFTLFELEELTAREIAEQLGLSEQVVFARVQRARAVFQRYVARARAQQPALPNPAQRSLGAAAPKRRPG
ncbi:MAG: sigma-70 family RNA polymerase sigma factor [Deltaproteobacteria bacterium]